MVMALAFTAHHHLSLSIMTLPGTTITPFSGWPHLHTSVMFMMFWRARNSQLTNGASASLGLNHLIYKWMAAVQVICKRECEHARALCIALKHGHPRGEGAYK